MQSEHAGTDGIFEGFMRMLVAMRREGYDVEHMKTLLRDPAVQGYVRGRDQETALDDFFAGGSFYGG